MKDPGRQKLSSFRLQKQRCLRKGEFMDYKHVKNLVLAALFLALGLALPFLTGQIPTIGKMLSPMHIAVYLCGLVCGWQYGLLVGLICPILRSALFGIPVMYPVAIEMMFECAAYGAIIGLIYHHIRHQNVWAVVVSLIIAMLAGRAVYGLAMGFLLGFGGSGFTMNMFLAGAFINAWPGIILHLVLIPAVMVILDKTKTVPFKR